MARGDGTTELFDWVAGHDAYHGHLDTIDAVHFARPVGFMSDGPTILNLAAQMGQTRSIPHPPHVARRPAGRHDRLSHFQAVELELSRHPRLDGHPAISRARAVKGPEELEAQRLSAKACHDGFERMFAATKPGVTESDIWAHLHAANIEWEGEWINARYLLSGRRQTRGPRRPAFGYPTGRHHRL
ncbi:MAG: hypothetical protein Ct9H300mP31_07870 [Acidimicrobiaceae bacterium]|nr:MAG: hypothetical protein Ct9H300mP31_07870 [Acidimicrobiaceae bacterium]